MDSREEHREACNSKDAAGEADDEPGAGHRRAGHGGDAIIVLIGMGVSATKGAKISRD